MGKIPGLLQPSKSSKELSTPLMSVIDTNNKIWRINTMNKGITNHPYFSDPLVVPRVKQYLEENRSNVFVNLDDMVEFLQKKYREYGRKKRSAFKSVVKKALEVVIHSYSMSERSSGYDVSEDSDDDDDDDDDIDVDIEEDNEMMDESSNNVNNHIVSMYLQNQKQNSGVGQELINISSDEDSHNESSNHKPSSTKSKVVTITRAPKVSNDNTSTTKPVVIKAVKMSGEENELTNSVKRKAPAINIPIKKRRTIPVTTPTVTFEDIGGCEKVLKEVSQLLLHIRHPEVYKALGVSAPRGFLLHGPPGSGKTLLAHAIAGELGVSLVKVAGPEMVGSQSGESEERIRDLFSQAVALAPSVLFIDEVDAITPHRETAQRGMERRIVAQLLSSLDELNHAENGDQVLVIGATNRPDGLDPALRRAGRFDREVCLGIPDSGARAGILKTLCKDLKLAPDVSLDSIVLMTPGFVGADLKALVTEAAMAAINRMFTEMRRLLEEKQITDNKMKVVNSCKSNKCSESISSVCVDDVTLVSTTEENIEIEVIEEETEVKDKVQLDASDDVVEVKASPLTVSLLKGPPITTQQLENLYIMTTDFEVALKSVQPSAKREGFATVPDVTWNDIGSLQDIRQELQMAIMAPVRYPKQFEALGLNKPTGILLCGPPGCGKTLLAKAVANEAGINFISVKGPELLNMYVGESERAVRQCFQRARNSQPCVIFFDELDALCPMRSNLNETGASRVVNQLLTEMDGVEGRTGVFLMAATNRPDIVDPAVMRPGRLDKVLYVGLPAPSDRLDILRALTKNGTKPVLSEDVDLERIANDHHCQGYTGADLAALIREAGVQALKEFMTDIEKNSLTVAARHFASAFEKIRPSVSTKPGPMPTNISDLKMETKKNSRVQLSWIYKLKKVYLEEELQKFCLPTDGTVGELRIRLKNFMKIEFLTKWASETADTSQDG